MIRTIITACLLLLPAVAWAKPIRVVASVPELAAIAAQVGGEDIEVSTMTLPTQDPHWVDAKPSLALDMSKADLLIYVGLDLEVGWLPNLMVASRNARIQLNAQGNLDCSQFVTVMEIPTGPVTRAQGDLHPGGNPHYFYDPRNAAAIGYGIAHRLARIDPDKAAAYEGRAEAFAEKSATEAARWKAELVALEGRSVLEYHRSFIYVAQWLELSIAADLEPKPGIPPNPAHVARVIKTAETQKVPLILQENFHPTNMSQIVAQKTGAELVLLQSGPDVESGQDWFAHKEQWVKQLKEAL